MLIIKRSIFFTTYIMDKVKQFRTTMLFDLPIIQKVELPFIPSFSDNNCLLLEFRVLPHIEHLLRNMIIKLNGKNNQNREHKINDRQVNSEPENNWMFTIVCGNDNYDFFINLIEKLDKNITLIKLDYDNINVHIYNEMFKNKMFWKMIHGEKILVWQEDTYIFKNNINEFINYDYIGSYWCHEPFGVKVGNGGFSLRSKKMMIDVCELSDHTTEMPIDLNEINTNNEIRNDKIFQEDLWFTYNILSTSLKNKYKIADKNTAFKFAFENSFNCDDPMATHQGFITKPIQFYDLYNKSLSNFYGVSG